MSNPAHDDTQELEFLQKNINRSTSWFYWICGLSIINSLIIAFEGDLSFVVGLGLTQLIDGIAAGAVADGAPVSVIYVALAVSILMSGAFALFGLGGQKRILPLYILGMVIYGLDGLIFLAFQDWLPVAFHAFALFGLSKAISPIRTYRQLQASAKAQAPAIA